MECVEARAFKSREFRELATKTAQQAIYDDFMCLNQLNGTSGLSSEDFSIDHFLDFSNDEELGDGSVEEEEEEEKHSLSVFFEERVAEDENNSNSSCLSFDSLLPGELSVPVEEIAGLEWVSQFVEDSLSEFPLSLPALKQKAEEHAKIRAFSDNFPSSFPAKARTKRSRNPRRAWSLRSMPLLTESSSSSSSASSWLSSATSFESTDAFQGLDFLVRNDYSGPPTKKTKKKPTVENGGASAGNPFQRRCSHCQVQKTPQWRTGPLGPKTLCNACGVRFKSGRLFPEYRPACSPTFSTEIHSNSHRKVLEMRKKKEVSEQESTLSQTVQSF